MHARKSRPPALRAQAPLLAGSNDGGQIYRIFGGGISLSEYTSTEIIIAQWFRKPILLTLSGVVARLPARVRFRGKKGAGLLVLGALLPDYSEGEYCPLKSIPAEQIFTSQSVRKRARERARPLQ